VFPAASVTTTENVYAPAGSDTRSPVHVEVHATGPITTAPMEFVTVQVAVVPLSAVHSHTGLVTGDGLAGAVTTGRSGAVVSSRYVTVVDGPTLPAASIAQTVTSNS